MVTYSVIDLETTYSKDLGSTSNPFIKVDGEWKNNVVTSGVSYSGDNREVDIIRYGIQPDIFKRNIIVAHNSHFEMKWMLRYHKDLFFNWFSNGGILWCTKFTHYSLSGCSDTDTDLDTISVKYGGTVKPDGMRQQWDAGVRTEDVPEYIINTYQASDTSNTRIIFEKQLKIVQDKKLQQLYKHHFDFMVYTGLCHTYGVYVNQDRLGVLREQYKNELDKLDTSILEIVYKMLPIKQHEYFNLRSNAHLSAVLFGGDLKYPGQEPSITPSGKQRMSKDGIPLNKKVEKSVSINGLISSKFGTPTKVPGVYKVNKEVLEVLKDEHQLVSLIVERGKIDQLVKTFLSPDGNGVGGSIYEDSCVRGHLSHHYVATKRLNSYAPNLQNLDGKSELKSIFTSRHKDGLLVEADWSQLEKCTTGQNTRDPDFCKDLHDGVDMHSKAAAGMLQISYENFMLQLDYKEEYKMYRKIAKPFGFSYDYGASPPTMITRFPGSTLQQAEDFIKAQKEAYPTVHKWYEHLRMQAMSRVQITNKFTKNGFRKKLCAWNNIFGAKISIYSEESALWLLERECKDKCPDSAYTRKLIVYRKACKTKTGTTENLDFWHKNNKATADIIQAGVQFTSFSPTLFKNYPNQNLAAELVAIFGARLVRALLPYIRKGAILPINTIHDSYLFDCINKAHADLCVSIIDELGKSMVKYIKDIFNIEFIVPLVIECKIGKNWKEMDKV